MNGVSAEGKKCCLCVASHRSEILALLKGPGCHLVFLVLTDAVAHLPCAEISIFYCDSLG